MTTKTEIEENGLIDPDCNVEGTVKVTIPIFKTNLAYMLEEYKNSKNLLNKVAAPYIQNKTDHNDLLYLKNMIDTVGLNGIRNLLDAAIDIYGCILDAINVNDETRATVASWGKDSK